jgi:hypothetical protein
MDRRQTEAGRQINNEIASCRLPAALSERSRRLAFLRMMHALRELVRRPVAGKHIAGNVPGFAGSASYGAFARRP